MRIYRDVRFSKNKQPYKTQVAAWWARQGLEKTSGGGFYFHLSATEITVAAGCYMPEKEQLLAIRRMLLERHQEYRALIGSRKLTAEMQLIDAMKMSRAPKGFPTEHPALDLVMQRQWGVSSTLPSGNGPQCRLGKADRAAFQAGCAAGFAVERAFDSSAQKTTLLEQNARYFSANVL